MKVVHDDSDIVSPVSQQLWVVLQPILNSSNKNIQSFMKNNMVWKKFLVELGFAKDEPEYDKDRKKLSFADVWSVLNFIFHKLVNTEILMNLRV